jgi:hypothetical protein
MAVGTLMIPYRSATRCSVSIRLGWVGAAASMNGRGSSVF